MSHHHSPQENPGLLILPRRMSRAEAPALRQQLSERIERGITLLTLDLHQVQYIDASGLSVLVTAYLAQQQQGGRVVLLSPSASVRSRLVATRLHRLFEVYEAPHPEVTGQ